MATFNMTLEMANEYYRATDGGAHPPWTKEQRAAMVQAGRIKLPDHDFAREYLGEWRDHADAMAYATTATRPAMVHQKCALCSTVLDLGPESTFAQTYEATMAAHHAVCPKRPIAIGDTVRIVRTVDDHVFAEAVGQTGTIADIDHTKTPYCVKCDLSDRMWCKEVERIPRPSEAQCPKVGDRIPLEPPITPAPVDGLDREQCLARWMENRLAVEGRHYASPGQPPNVMTRMQRDVGRALWLQRFGARQSAELRAMVAADREEERSRVRVDIQDVE